MSFIVHADDREIRFEQFHEMNAYIEQRLTSWNNFEVEKGRWQITLTVMKPATDNNNLGISVNDSTTTSEVLN
jgi:hypothetical protein